MEIQRKGKLNWDAFKSQFHPSWHAKMRPFIESEECDKIYAFLKAESKRGKKVAPISMHVWRCFKETSLDDLKVVLVGMCPYHTFKNDAPVADGLLMGCSITEQVQPSLDQFYRAMEKEFYDGLNLNIIENPDVSFLAHQGVLMFNAALTTEMNKAGSHMEIWEPLVKYLFEEIINHLGVPVVFLGKDAARYKKYTGIFTHVFEISHPASASYKGIEWDTEGVFTKVNRLLEENNGFSVMWVDIDAPF
jgi:uracil-DNA glycosylase